MIDNLLDKESILTTISVKQLEKLNAIKEYIITDMLLEHLLNKETCFDVDVGFGTLSIRFEDNQLKFKFKPSAKLEESLINALKNNTNELVIKLESALSERIINTYKDLL